MVQGLLETDTLITGDKPGEKPLMRVRTVKNQDLGAHRHQGVTDKIRTALIKSGKVQFLDRGMQNDSWTSTRRRT